MVVDAAVVSYTHFPSEENDEFSGGGDRGGFRGGRGKLQFFPIRFIFLYI